MSDTDVLIIGAGAAGLGAAIECSARGISHRVIEASHRVGGRAHTEYIGPRREPFDLGCHWLHSGGENPMNGVARRLGFSADTSGWGRLRIMGRGLDTEDTTEWDEFDAQAHRCLHEAALRAEDLAVIDAVPRESFWTPSWDYVFSVNSSVDPDQASVRDVCRYRDTGEDWPVKEGMGALVAKMADPVPVELNTAARSIDWSGQRVRIDTSRGPLEAKVAILTVSTGVLAAGDIRFRPELPLATREAIHDLPLGAHNRIALVMDGPVLGTNPPAHVAVLPEQDDDVQMTFRLAPFGYSYVVAATGGRHADWLEKAGSRASFDCAIEKLKDAFGTGISKHIVETRASAWRTDPLIRGAYSAALPGGADARATLGTPVGDRLIFAGEATHTSFQATCHGALLSGVRAVEQATTILDT